MNTNDTNPADDVMCDCSGTTRGKVQSLFEQGLDMSAISQWTGVNSGCGGCEWDITKFLDNLAEQHHHDR